MMDTQCLLKVTPQFIIQTLANREFSLHYFSIGAGSSAVSRKQPQAFPNRSTSASYEADCQCRALGKGEEGGLPSSCGVPKRPALSTSFGKNEHRRHSTWKGASLPTAPLYEPSCLQGEGKRGALLWAPLLCEAWLRWGAPHPSSARRLLHAAPQGTEIKDSITLWYQSQAPLTRASCPRSRGRAVGQWLLACTPECTGLQNCQLLAVILNLLPSLLQAVIVRCKNWNPAAQDSYFRSDNV